MFYRKISKFRVSQIILCGMTIKKLLNLGELPSGALSRYQRDINVQSWVLNKQDSSSAEVPLELDPIECQLKFSYLYYKPVNNSSWGKKISHIIIRLVIDDSNIACMQCHTNASSPYKKEYFYYAKNIPFAILLGQTI